MKDKLFISQKGISLIAGLMIILVILVGSIGIFFVSQKLIKQDEIIQEQDTKTETSLELIIPKDTYKVGEKLTNEKYIFTYQGEAFKGIVLYRCGAAFNREIKTIEPGVTEFPFLNFSGGTEKINEGHFKLTPHSDTFSGEGEFEYMTSIYRCSDLELSEEECSEDLPLNLFLDLVSEFEPIAFVSKTITVIKDLSVPEGTTVLDCDLEQDPYCYQRFMDVFEENLKLCKPSEGTMALGLEPLFGLIRSYEIVGIENNLCVVNFSFLETSLMPIVSPTLLNKTMTCKYSEAEATIEKVVGGENCSGPLYDELEKVLETMPEEL